MVTFDNYKDRIGSDGDLAFPVEVGKTVLLTTRNIRVRVEVTDTDMISSGFIGVITCSDVQEDDEEYECLAKGATVAFGYDQVAHVSKG